MKIITYSVLIFASLILFNAPKAMACTCLLIVGDDKRQVGKAYDQSSDVFAGEVIEITKKLKDYSLIKFKVKEVWKGNSESEITLKVSENKSGCAYYPFELGKNYLVYSEKYENELYLPNCSRTSALESNRDNKDRLLLNKIKKKVKISPK